ncbi:MAG: hypothetical protein N4A33_08730 [Bacteriovoracaceae bacterium]|nr:hypothetical protein [Bacteriovoracaceae bacterium]
MSLSSGYDMFLTGPMKSHNSYFGGFAHQLEVGMAKRTMMLAGFARTVKSSGEVKHDNVLRNIDHEAITVGAKASFIVSRNLFVTLALHLSQLKHSFNTNDEYVEAGLIKAYKTKKELNSQGMGVGLGYNFVSTRSYSFYCEYIMNTYSIVDAVSHTAFLGFRWKINFRL